MLHVERCYLYSLALHFTVHVHFGGFVLFHIHFLFPLFDLLYNYFERMISYQRALEEDIYFLSSCSEPLRSTRRQDGLWESIETDDNHTLATDPNDLTPISHWGLDLRHVLSKSIGVQTSPESFPAPEMAPSKNLSELAPLGTTPGNDVATQETQILTPRPSMRSNSGNVAEQPVPTNGPRRRRGRPRNPPVFRNRRNVRFSDPIPSDLEPTMVSRDSHIFIRLLNVVVQETVHVSAAPGPRRRQEFSWNNRGKGWRVADRRSDEGLVEIVNIFDLAGSGGVDIYPVILPTERGGARQPVRMVWDAEKACFTGSNQDGEVLSVALGEMKDMARDPWARQFVGYIMS